MSITPLSTLTPYCDGPTLVKRYDVRYLGDLLTDIGYRADAEAISLGDPQLLEGGIVQEFLMDASGMVEASCLVADRYSPIDLQSLTGASQRFLAGIVADLAVFGIECRRQPDKEPTPRQKMAFHWLDQLEKGTAIFGTQEAADAGLPQMQYQTNRDLISENLSTVRAARYFGMRNNMYRCNP